MNKTKNVFKNFKYASDISDICSPLNAININNFSYTKIYEDSSRFILTSDPNWHEFFYQELYQDAWHINKSFNDYKSSYCIWDRIDSKTSRKKNNIAIIASRDFNRQHGLTISIKNNHSYEVYSFNSNKTDDNINDIYEYNPDYFYNFLYYFKEKGKNILKQASDNKIIVPNAGSDNVNSKIITSLADLDIKKYHIAYMGEDLVFSRREVDCIYWAQKGKTIEETGLILSLSKNTVRTHLDKVRDKLNVSKLVSIINIFNEYKLI